VPLDLPGDLYSYVAEHVWSHLEELAQGFSKAEIQETESFIDNLIELKKKINTAEPKSDLRKEYVEKIQLFKAQNAELMERACIFYWLRIKDHKHRRKIVKR
jgi:hypothetical protein